MLFGNDSILANAILSFDVRCKFSKKEDDVIDDFQKLFSRICVKQEDNYNYSNTDKIYLDIDDDDYLVHVCKLSYFESVYLIPKLIDYLKKNAKSFSKSSLYYNIFFENDFCNLNNINITKFVLNFNENYVTKRFPDLFNSPLCKSLTDIKPVSLNSCQNGVEKQLEGLKALDDSDNLYCVDFTNITLGGVKFKYIGGKEWYKKEQDVIDVINYSIMSLYESVVVGDLNDRDKKKLDELTTKFDSVSRHFDSYDEFKNNYKDIELTSDMESETSIVNLRFSNFKDLLFNLVVCNNIKKACINYDSDVNKLQLKDAKLSKTYQLKGFDLVECEFEDCNIKDCDLYDCKVTGSDLTGCNLFGYSDANDSRLHDCFVSRNCELKDCTVDGTLGNMAGRMIGGLIKKTTVIISTAEFENTKKVKINEIQ